MDQNINYISEYSAFSGLKLKAKYNKLGVSLLFSVTVRCIIYKMARHLACTHLALNSTTQVALTVHCPTRSVCLPARPGPVGTTHQEAEGLALASCGHYLPGLWTSLGLSATPMYRHSCLASAGWSQGGGHVNSERSPQPFRVYRVLGADPVASLILEALPKGGQNSVGSPSAPDTLAGQSRTLPALPGLDPQPG